MQSNHEVLEHLNILAQNILEPALINGGIWSHMIAVQFIEMIGDASLIERIDYRFLQFRWNRSV